MRALETEQTLAAPVVEEIVSVKRGVAQKFVRAAMPLVRPRFKYHVEDAAERPSELSRKIGAEQFEFLDCVDRGEYRNAVEPIHGGVRGGNTVNHGIHRARSGSIHRISHFAIAVADGAGYAGSEKHQAIDVPRIKRKVRNGTVVDHLRKRRILGFEPGDFGGDHHRFCYLADGKLHVDARGLLHLQHDAFAETSLESIGRHFNAIVAARQQRDRVIPA